MLYSLHDYNNQYHNNDACQEVNLHCNNPFQLNRGCWGCF